ncbi:MAG: A/G-specific adenine glycosylase [Verrucomicrobiae bacterium]
MIPKTFHRALRAWFRKSGRDLPWRRTRDPYAILVSEFMLQQTTVAAVIPYFERWMRAFPDVPSLARADERDVLGHWQGLGYYSRGRNLLRTAREIAKRFGGAIPCELRILRGFPGIGPYTAAAVAAFAFDDCVPVLDANIIRVIARLADYKDPVTAAAGRLFLDRTARRFLPESGGRDHSSALMDLGATICTPGVPDCPACPVRKFCSAKNPEKIPWKPPRKSVIRERDARGFATRGDEVFLVPSDGPRWRGLWLLPPAPPGDKPILEITFAVTRHRICMEVFRVRPSKSWTPFPLAALPPMPTPHRRALERLSEPGLLSPKSVTSE